MRQAPRKRGQGEIGAAAFVEADREEAGAEDPAGGLPREETDETEEADRTTSRRRAYEVTGRGEIVEAVGKRVRVRYDDGTEAILPTKGEKVVIGDRVTLSGGVVTGVEPRKSELMRSASGAMKPICANATLVLVVTATVDPPFRTGLVDRVLVAAGAAGLRAGIVLNKCDAGMPEAVLERMAYYEALGYAIFLISATQDKGLDAIRERLRGRPLGGEEAGDEAAGGVTAEGVTAEGVTAEGVTAEGVTAEDVTAQGETAVLVGHSGVGKTSLVTALVPENKREIGGLDPWGRGRHTTTSALLVEVASGGRLIDLPGVREFGLEHVSRMELQQYFPEFEGVRCKYNNCLHDGDDGCMVEQVCDEERLESYRKLLSELIP